MGGTSDHAVNPGIIGAAKGQQRLTSLTRYFTRQLAVSTVTITVTLAALVLLIRSLRLIDYVINRGVTLVSMLEMTLLLVPSILAIIVPIAVFAAITFTYNKLTADRELVVLRAAGFSPIHLARPAIYVALAATALVFILNLYISPQSYRSFKELRYKYRSNYANLFLQEGRFNTPIDGVTVYVRARTSDGELSGIFAHDNRDRERPVTWMAERGAISITEDGPQVVMFNGSRQEISDEDGRLTLVYFDQGSLGLEVLEPNLSYPWRQPQERFLPELLFPDDTEADRQYYNELVVEGHRRLATPFYAIAFALIALSVLLAGDFNRSGQSGRITIAVVLVAAVQIAGYNALNMATQRLELVALIDMVPAIAIVAAGYALARPCWLPRMSRPPTSSSIDARG